MSCSTLQAVPEGPELAVDGTDFVHSARIPTKGQLQHRAACATLELGQVQLVLQTPGSQQEVRWDKPERRPASLH